MKIWVWFINDLAVITIGNFHLTLNNNCFFRINVEYVTFTRRTESRKSQALRYGFSGHLKWPVAQYKTIESSTEPARPRFVGLQKYLKHVNYMIKRDLPVSWSLIEILSCHQSGTKESHEMRMRNASQSSNWVVREKETKKEGREGLRACDSFVPDWWQDRISIKLQLTGKSRLIM